MKNNLVKTEIDVKNNKVGIMRIGDVDYISLTDLAKYSNPENPANVIIHWMSNKGTFDYIGLWEQLNNENFNFTEFSEIKIKEVGYPSFTLSPKRWIQRTNDIELYELIVCFGIRPLSIAPFTNSFSHSIGCLFILFISSFSVQKLFRLL